MARFWKIYYAGPGVQNQVVAGETKADWEAAPWRGVQILIVRLGRVDDNASRKGYYEDNQSRRLFYDRSFYAWLDGDVAPSGVTPDAVLDFWATKTGDTAIKLGELSLNDLRSIGVKIGRSVPNAEFKAILQQVYDDTTIA